MSFFCPSCGMEMENVLWKNDECTDCPTGSFKESRNVAIAKGLGYQVEYIKIISGYLINEAGIHREPEIEIIPVINEHGCIAYEDYGPDWNVKVHIVPQYDIDVESAFHLIREAVKKELVFISLQHDGYRNLYHCTVKDSADILHRKSGTTVPEAISNTYYSIFTGRRYEVRDVYIISEEKQISFVITEAESVIVDGIPEAGPGVELNILDKATSFEEAKGWFNRVICKQINGDEDIPL